MLLLASIALELAVAIIALRAARTGRPYLYGLAFTFAVYVLSTMGRRAVHQEKGDAADLLFEGRDRLNLYGKALLALTLANLGDDARARTVLRNAMQYVEQNDETQIAWVRTPPWSRC